MPFRVFLGVTGEQIRAARALLRIEQADLAQRAQVSLETIKRLERIRGVADANVRTIKAIVLAFAAEGVYFEVEENGRIGVYRTPSKPGSEGSPTGDRTER